MYVNFPLRPVVGQQLTMEQIAKKGGGGGSSLHKPQPQMPLKEQQPFVPFIHSATLRQSRK